MPDIPERLIEIVGGSTAIVEIKEYLSRVAASDCNVLITGETGTGKELAAAYLHSHSPRHTHRLIPVNCAAIPDSLIESELFGHESGAFTGAVGRREGMMELAARGTLFLDEIGDMSPLAQAKVLRIIESKDLYRLGGKSSVPLDVRIVAATNRDVEKCVETGSFRKDLYFRLNVARIHLPPLREHKEDIPLLANRFVESLNRRYHRRIDRLGAELLTTLTRYDWPGNVRELKNLLEAAFIAVKSDEITIRDVPLHFQRALGLNISRMTNERDVLICTLQSTNWNKSQAAEKLNWSRMTLYRKLAKHRIARATEPHRAAPDPSTGIKT